MSLYKATQRFEQETTLNYDKGSNEWFISTDVPKHIKKFEPIMDQKKYTAHKDALGNTVFLEGKLSEDTLISVRKKRRMTDKQKRAAAERLAAARKK